MAEVVICRLRSTTDAARAFLDALHDETMRRINEVT
jgi:hypothetical protein